MLIAAIPAVIALIGVFITVTAGNKNTEKQLAAQSELMLYRIQQLEEKQDKHNAVIERTIKLENKQEEMEKLYEEKFKVANHRIEDLEQKVG